ncbi:MFS general substrate transporter [Aspergillus sclerotiicarbonarius CBS 121057]|uniref:MFS general substrate transporter n=1 Tax=Aspergillus sclerotiicarbonarius (strain CBS 121057 / IBT 28362) TaxID=1448318 RepID=A0A319ESA3_ASPSB|nr:MFS general substrate transporter [Aspergillus sclerotiicarbonarius CBS 121057]
MTCAASAAFVIGYDSNCVATIIPILTNEFDALGDMVWYSTAYLITSTAAVLSFGKLYSLFRFKIVFASVMGVFLVGTAVCTVAKTSIAFICGRAVTGLGCAGIMSGINILISRVTPLEKRPFWQGFVGTAECLAICAGPLIAGVITRYASWRACFYVTIPVAAYTFLLVLLLFKDIEAPADAELSLREKLSALDLPGVACFVPAVVCLVLALEWGGTSYSWSDFRVLLPLTLAAPLIGAFVGCGLWRGKKATVPLRLLGQRTVFASVLYAGFASAGLYIMAYYLPMWFQTVRGQSTLMSGISTLPLVVGLTIAIISSGSLTSFIGYYTPALILGSCLSAIGAGLLTTMTSATPTVKWVVYQAIYGIGCGIGWQSPYIAVQTVLSKEDTTPGLVFLAFTFSLGAIIALAVAQNLYISRLVTLLSSVLPGITAKTINNSGMTALIQKAGEDSKPIILNAYNDAFQKAIFIGVAVACASFICALVVEVKSVKGTETTASSRISSEKKSEM